MKVFLTGGSGFVGGAMIPALIQAGHQILAACRSQTSAEKVRGLGARPVLVDFNDAEGLSRDLEDSQAIIHMAARLDVWGEYEDFYNTNVRLTETLLEAANQTEIKTFIYVGAAAVVVNGDARFDVDESAPIPDNPAGYYGTTKAMAEDLIRKTLRSDKSHMILRPPFVWGLNCAAFDQIEEAVRKGRFFWVASGNYELSTCHVKNLTRAVALTLESDLRNQTYFLTDGPAMNFRKFISRMLVARGVEPPGMSLPRPVCRISASLLEFAYRILALEGRPVITGILLDLIGNQFSLNDEKARRELGFENVVDYEEGFRELEASGENGG